MLTVFTTRFYVYQVHVYQVCSYFVPCWRSFCFHPRQGYVFIPDYFKGKRSHLENLDLFRNKTIGVNGCTDCRLIGLPTYRQTDRLRCAYCNELQRLNARSSPYWREVIWYVIKSTWTRTFLDVSDIDIICIYIYIYIYIFSNN